ncbi:hypothetical protein [Nocardia sp. NPDC058497]|uniref:hypothetical protein n=1 Tax=Nocardia sp. NPDC058497 TaxID=3346529 RepID=UPI0036597BE1
MFDCLQSVASFRPVMTTGIGEQLQHSTGDDKFSGGGDWSSSEEARLVETRGRNFERGG